MTFTSTLPAGIAASHLRATSTAAARSASVRSAKPGRRPSISLATALTPRTRCAASSAAIFFRYESTQPVRVTTPSLTATPISLGCARLSHCNSSRTSAWIASSVRMPTAMVFSSFPCLTYGLFQGISSLAIQQGSQHGLDYNRVLNLADTRCGPGGILRRLFLRRGPHRPPQDDLAALHFDRDTPGIGLRIAEERALDLLLEVCWQHTRLVDPDEIGDAFDPCLSPYAAVG